MPTATAQVRWLFRDLDVTLNDFVGNPHSNLQRNGGGRTSLRVLAPTVRADVPINDCNHGLYLAYLVITTPKAISRRSQPGSTLTLEQRIGLGR